MPACIFYFNSWQKIAQNTVIWPFISILYLGRTNFSKQSPHICKSSPEPRVALLPNRPVTYLDNSLKKQLAFSQLTDWIICRLQ